MPTVTLTLDTLAAFGVLRAHLVPTFTLEGRGLLEALLASRGFDIARAIRVVELKSREGFHADAVEAGGAFTIRHAASCTALQRRCCHTKSPEGNI
jgi:hypothetical protein